jgi:hypothetical protein
MNNPAIVTLAKEDDSIEFETYYPPQVGWHVIYWDEKTTKIEGDVCSVDVVYEKHDSGIKAYFEVGLKRGE